MRTLFATLALAMTTSASAQRNDGPPLPADVRIVAPASAVDADLARLSGMWIGSWDSAHPTILVVERIEGDRASVIYSTGTRSGRYPSPALWRRFSGSWDAVDKKLVVPIGRNAATYRVEGSTDALSALLVDLDGLGLRARMSRFGGIHTAAEDLATPPADTRVEPPSAQSHAELARFSGQWRGFWGGLLSHVLVVERVDGDNAQVVYAFGKAPPWGIREGGSMRRTATYDDTKRRLIVRLSERTVAEYELTSSGELHGEYVSGPMRSSGVLSRQGQSK